MRRAMTRGIAVAVVAVRSGTHMRLHFLFLYRIPTARGVVPGVRVRG